MSHEVKEMTPQELLEKLEAKEELQVIDVREVDEWNAGHIKEAKLIPLGFLPHRIDELDKNIPIVMVCRSGARSHNATAYLSAQGYDVANMVGGMLAWPGEVEQ
ncbi:rhodanese-like domain-containing protein [Brevibacillus porteri]|uniref:Sulfurtransferase n=1 Tax=Brevibacillus porteri TaxID=2126350 RepID=A0ABX5FPU7_9BACL|nr:rhodanese-like domain-containing protein [Brevibacillus porteri]MED1797088.1 rhodanese-like domain-containing protein [Brevibacillus porteri]MED2129841.1 rhodanese-like domain-containing protein [Brevibacillus porteri]MED2744643.1 rhodanese-like domain-containing protein [Brevibacillus porteri]MED2814436.1 rhodanese-like domain-containing protein [Brevibacillus porteri]MED2893860.1 rhodanese-like domain-containing protein [Brevibacillus porteri]